MCALIELHVPLLANELRGSLDDRGGQRLHKHGPALRAEMASAAHHLTRAVYVEPCTVYRGISLEEYRTCRPRPLLRMRARE